MSSIIVDPPPRPSKTPTRPAEPARAPRSIKINGREVSVPAGSTLLEACRSIGIEVPTLCFLETLHPVNACRLCVVEVKGSRTLVASCSRAVDDGMEVETDSERVRHSRKMVLEFLASSVDLSTAPALQELIETYGAKPERHGAACETVKQAPKIDNDLYTRDYSKCVLCYKCVEACGVDAQNTFAIAVGGRGFGAGITTEWNVPLPESACVYCGNCVGVCPTGALMPKSEHDLRAAGTWNPQAQRRTDTICPYCGVGCTLTLHVQDNQIVKVTSPIESSVTSGNLCIKGRFGYEFVQLRRK